MSPATPIHLYPIALIEDRYQGVYSGGRWLAVARASQLNADVSRIAWIMEDGPGSDDVEAAEFWSSRPEWVATGTDPNDALSNLLAKQA